MNAQQIEELVSLQRTFFETGTTLSLDFRLQSLKKLHDAILRMEPQINAALQSDLGKSATETYMCETGMTLSELSYMRRHLRRFAKDRHVLTPLAQFPSDSFVVREPYGVALIMSPWNYPFMLLMEPLIGALAAGNCCILKPSAYSPAPSAVSRALSRRNRSSPSGRMTLPTCGSSSSRTSLPISAAAQGGIFASTLSRVMLFSPC